MSQRVGEQDPTTEQEAADGLRHYEDDEEERQDLDMRHAWRQEAVGLVRAGEIAKARELMELIDASRRLSDQRRVDGLRVTVCLLGASALLALTAWIAWLAAHSAGPDYWKMATPAIAAAVSLIVLAAQRRPEASGSESAGDD